MKTDVLVIGAGAAGLAAAYELSLVSKKVIVLEARDRSGGRICSIKDNRFKGIVEAGAEFIHGKLPVTLGLLKKGNIKHHSAEGKIWEIEKGEIAKKKDFIDDWDKLMKELESLDQDMPILQFLNRRFPGEEHHELKESAIKFIEGYNAADTNKASSFALREEWKNEGDEQERIANGYMELMHFLENEIRRRGNDIFLSNIVDHIEWQKGKVMAKTNNGKHYTASQVLITLPLGVWQAEGQQAHISFAPALKEKTEAAQKMGFGGVIKINLQFQNNLWEEETKNKMKDAGFIFSDAELPTWWTQEPIKNGQLTGWIAGPRADKLKELSEEEFFRKALKTLAYIFGVEQNLVEKKLIAYHVTNWIKDPFARGAYSYATLDTYWAKQRLAQPVEQTLYFAGEALYNGTETGTVEGALANGIEVAREIILQSTTT